MDTNSTSQLEINPWSSWYLEWSKAERLVIAGPCSAESYEQLEATYLAMQKCPDWKVLRAGIWKPRSRPGDFQGDERSLEWIKALKKKHRVLVAVEVATPRHVDMALAAGVDILWVGARTVVLPFVVDDLASSLAGVKTSLLIKNPISPDISLWRGAVERFANVGLKNIALVHRGFSLPHRNGLRNFPMWSLVAQMKMYFPNISVIADPSHIAGDFELVPVVAQQALNLGCDGLMVECHPNPVQALSDASQQLTLEQMELYLRTWHWPKKDVSVDLLRHARLEIDEVDQQLLSLLKKRDQLSERIAMLKRDHNLPIIDVDRFSQMLAERKNWFQNDDHFVRELFEIIHARSIDLQLNKLQ